MISIFKRPMVAVLLAGVLVNTGCNEDPEIDATVLDCAYFNENRTLTDDPDKVIDYLITCDMEVTADIIVMPGVTIAFDTDAGIQVLEGGSFNAEGTTGASITFTGKDADNGSWSGIYIESNDPKNKFQYCIVEYAGGTAHNSNNDRGAFVIWADAKASILNCTIRHSQTYAINAIYGNADITLTDNVYAANTLAPLYMDAAYLAVPDAESQYVGNGEDRVVLRIGEPLAANATWGKIGVPYRITANGSAELNINADLTIEPGVQLFFDADCGLRINDGASMYARGSEIDPIRFAGTTTDAGSWGGIYFNFTTNTLNEISYASIEHAGNPEYDGAIYMWADPVVTVHHVNFSDIGTCAMWSGGSGTINPNLTHYDNTFVAVAGGELCHD